MLVQDVITNINGEASGIRETLEAVSSNVGYQLSDSMNTIWNSADQVITTYGDKFTSGITGVQNAINALKDVVQKAIDASNKKADTTIKNGVTKPASSNTTNKPQTTTTAPTTQGNGKVEIGDAVTFLSGSYYYSSDGRTPTGTQMHGQTVYITNINNASWAKKKYHIARDKAGSHPLGWVDLNQISGYENGTKRVPYDQLAELLENRKDETIVTEDGRILRKMTQGEMVLDNRSTENLWSLAKNPAEYLKEAFLEGIDLDSMMQIPRMENPVSEKVEENNNTIVNVNISIDHVESYNDFIRQLQSDKKGKKLIQSLAFDDLTGRGNLNVFSTKI